MKHFLTKVKAWFKMILPWVDFAKKEYLEVKAFIKLQKENAKNAKNENK